MISDLMQISLKDASDADKLQQPLRLNYVNSELPFTPDMVVIDKLILSGYIATDDVCGDGTTDWDDSSVSGVMTVQGRAVIVLFSNTNSSILTKEILSSRWDIGLESIKETL